jgi:hypothetical protein
MTKQDRLRRARADALAYASVDFFGATSTHRCFNCPSQHVKPPQISAKHAPLPMLLARSARQLQPKAHRGVSAFRILPDASMDLPVRIRELLIKAPFGLSAASIDLIAEALEFDPSRRPQNAAEFANRISEDLA